MTTIVIDAAAAAKFREAGGTAIVTDEAGNFLGQLRRPTEADYEGRDLTFRTAEELNAYLASVKTVTAAEVEQRLRELRKCS